MSKAPERDVETLLRGAAFSNRAHKQGGTQMSDEKRREELKAKINEQLDKFSIEELEKVAGGKIIKNDDGTYSVYDKKSGTNSENGYTDPGTPIWINGDNPNVTV